MAWPIKLFVWRTRQYAQIFHYCLSPSQRQRFLLTPVPLSVSREKLESIKFKLLQLWIFKLIPWVRLVALTGTRAMDNARADDDIDLMIITAANRLWLTRLLLTCLLFPWLRRGKQIARRLCLNLWLDETALAITPQNLFTAHEICQAVPLYNQDKTYEKFIKANQWVKQYLANWTI
jgi:hypothetical protein